MGIMGVGYHTNYTYYQQRNSIAVKSVGTSETSEISGTQASTQDDLNFLRKWRDTQYDAGNMVGYHQAEKECNALLNKLHEQNGTERTITSSSGETIKVSAMDGRLKSSIIGFGSVGEGDDFRLVTASYADNSTAEDPVVEVKISAEDGTSQAYQVNLNQINMTNATQLELFAACAHRDAQDSSSNQNAISSYQSVCNNPEYEDYLAGNAEDFVNQKQDWYTIVSESESRNSMDEKIQNMLDDYFENISNGVLDENGVNALEKIEETTRGEALSNRVNGGKTVPYSHLAKDGVIEYNGVVFNCDYEKNRITLGDVSNPKNCLNIPLSEGGSLVVNVDNLGDLSDAIGMFSPEDVKRILQAIAQYNKTQEVQQEIDKDTNSIGDSATESTETGQIEGADQSTEDKNIKQQYSEALNEFAETLKKKIDNGETENSYQIGGQSFTETEWNKLIHKIDKNIEAIKEEQEEREEKQKEELLKESQTSPNQPEESLVSELLRDREENEDLI